MSSCSLSAPSSCESGKPCAEGPSTSQAVFPGYAQPSVTCQPSPALAGSVPSSREATSPPETAGTDFVYFTTELANQAAMEYEMERFDSLLEWRNSKYRMRKEQEKDKLEQLTVLADTVEAERKAAKRKMEDRSEVDSKKPYTDLNQVQSDVKKDDENPLRKMEMMTNSCTFNASSCINDVIETPANGISIRKDDRSAKLEKLGEMERHFEMEHCRAEWEREVQAHQMKKLVHVQGLHSYASPLYPQPPGLHPNIGTNNYQHARVATSSTFTAQTMTPLSAGAYLPGYPYSAVSGFPPGYPMSAPVKIPFSSPVYPPNPKGLICSPHHPVYAHVLANRTMQSPVPPGTVSSDPSTSCSPFPLHGQSPVISPFHRQPAQHPNYSGGYSTHGPTGKSANGLHPFSYSNVLPSEFGSAVPPNPGMLMVRRDGIPSFEPQLNAWPTSMTPTYPPSFPSQTGSSSVGHANTSTCQQQSTSTKHGVTA